MKVNNVLVDNNSHMITSELGCLNVSMTVALSTPK